MNTTFKLGEERLWYTCSCPDNWTGLNCDVYMTPTPTTSRDVVIYKRQLFPNQNFIFIHHIAQEMMCRSATPQSQPLSSSEKEVPHCSNPPSHISIETIHNKTNSECIMPSCARYLVGKMYFCISIQLLPRAQVLQLSMVLLLQWLSWQACSWLDWVSLLSSASKGELEKVGMTIVCM